MKFAQADQVKKKKIHTNKITVIFILLSSRIKIPKITSYLHSKFTGNSLVYTMGKNLSI